MEAIALIVFVVIIVGFTRFYWEPRILVVLAQLLLVITAIVLAAGKTDLAEHLAESVLYMWVAGMVLLLIQHLRVKDRLTK